MAFNYSPKPVIDNSLVLYLDAANSKSYISGSTTWNDISKIHATASLLNGPTFSTSASGCITFDGVDDIVQRSILNVGQNFTVGIWAKPAVTARKTLMSNAYISSGSEGFLFGIGNGNTDLLFTMGADTQFRMSVSGLVTANTWFYGCASYDGTTIRLYFNGNETAYSLTSGTPFTITYNSPLYLGNWATSAGPFYPTHFFSGQMGIAQLYNKTLSAAEIKQNFNAHKSRFGL